MCTLSPTRTGTPQHAYINQPVAAVTATGTVPGAAVGPVAYTSYGHPHYQQQQVAHLSAGGHQHLVQQQQQHQQQQSAAAVAAPQVCLCALMPLVFVCMHTGVCTQV